MLQKRPYSLLVIIVIMLSSCGLGKKFSSMEDCYKSVDGMTYDEIVKVWGEPDYKSDVETNQASIVQQQHGIKANFDIVCVWNKQKVSVRNSDCVTLFFDVDELAGGVMLPGRANGWEACDNKNRSTSTSDTQDNYNIPPTNTSTVSNDTPTNDVQDFNQFDRLPNSPLWKTGNKLFTDAGATWQLNVEVNGDKIKIVTTPGLNNASHADKNEIVSTETGTIIDNTIYSTTESGTKIKNAFRYLNGAFYKANNEGQYNEYKAKLVNDVPTIINEHTGFDTTPNSPLWDGSKNFCDELGLWYITVSVSTSNISVATFAGSKNTKINDKEHPTDINNAEIEDNIMYIFSNGKRIKNGYKYLNGAFYIANKKGEYKKYTECK